MRRILGAPMVAALAGLALLAATPADAGAWHGGGWHGGGWGGGGWHGGPGWHGGWGGGWRGPGWGGWRGGYWRGGYWNGGYWGGGYWGPGWGWGVAAAPVLVVGDVAYAPDASGCWVYRRVWSRPGRRGRYLGRFPVYVCQ